MEVVFQDTVIKIHYALIDDLSTVIFENKDKPLLLFYSGPLC